MAKTTKKTKDTYRICNLLPSPDTQSDWGIEQALASNAVAAPPMALPASVDLRADWWGIGDQETTGSCVGWSSTDSVARYHFVKADRLAKTEKLSPRFTWMASKELDQDTSRPQSFIEGAGTYLKTAVDVLRKYGCVTDAMLPFHISTFMYVGAPGDPNPERTFYATAATRKIGSYFNLGRDLNQWRTWLATQGPILVGLRVDKTWRNASSTQGKLDVFDFATANGGHAVALVGYTADNRFIVRNSWGKAWGDKGFAYASEAYINAGFYTESYGITL